jgi:membrane-associated phospholipid phosphatase
MVPSQLLVRLTWLSIALAILGCLAVRLPVALPGLLGVTAASAALFAGAWFYRHRRIEPRIADSLAGTGLIIAFTAACGTLSYVTASFNFPLQDAAMARIDRALGFDWVAMLAYVNERPWLAKALVYAYYSELFQVPLVVVALGLTGRARALDRFLAVYLMSALIIVLVAGLLPALGPFPFYQPDAAIQTEFTVGAGRWHIEQVQELRAGTFGTLQIEKIEGLVEFPSFHMALAINLIVALWAVPWLRWPGLLLNLLVIAGTLPEGGHYLIDIIVGGVIAVGCFVAYEKLIRREGYSLAGPLPAATPSAIPAE